ncbi:MAG: helix-turn-helix domain-containing protein [Chthoniobacter sp.]
MKTFSQKRPKLEPAAGDSALQVPALQRGLAMLEFLAGLPEGATLSELGNELDISIASVFSPGGRARGTRLHPPR